MRGILPFSLPLRSSLPRLQSRSLIIFTTANSAEHNKHRHVSPSTIHDDYHDHHHHHHHSQHHQNRHKKKSLLERVKISGVNVALDLFMRTAVKGFDYSLRNAVIERFDNGSVTCSLKVDKSLCNAANTLDSGAIITIVDLVGTLALVTIQPLNLGVSLEMNASYVLPAVLGDEIEMEGR